jgi:hypothetical protein
MWPAMTLEALACDASLHLNALMTFGWNLLRTSIQALFSIIQRSCADTQ